MENKITSNIEKTQLNPLHAEANRVWFIRMRMYLRALNLEQYLKNNFAGRSVPDDQAKHIIMSHLHDSIVLEVYKARSAKEMWDLLLVKFEKSSERLRDSDVTLP
jgi:hypothetical protein